MSAPCSRAASRIWTTLPEPTYDFASGRSRRARTTCATSAPALSTRREASSALSSASAGPEGPTVRLTRIARGRSGILRVLKRDRHRTCRDDRGDGVLVNHLRHGVLEQHDVLVEGFDLALELDAVHEVDGNRHMLFAQRVEERVL